jgi:hypothetical protein
MKTKVQKLISTAVLGLALLSQSLPTWAGSTSLFEVQVGTNYGRGPMTWARYSPDNQQYIGCTLQNSGGVFVRCFARDTTGRTSFCTSTDVKFANAAKALTDSSIIHFSSNPGSATCVYLSVTDSSTSLR